MRMKGINQEILEVCISRIKERKLEAPVIFFLELYRPFFTLFSVISEISFPIVAAFLGLEKAKLLLEVLKEPEQVDNLIAKLEGAS